MKKYSIWYNSIISRRRANPIPQEEYSETHHIHPRSLGGSDDRSNLVQLDAREHFICHWLLVKMTVGNDRVKMIYALNGMKRTNSHQHRYETKITARVYAKIREEFAKVHSEYMSGREAWNKGRKEDRPEVLAKIKEGCAKRPAPSPESIAAAAEKRRGQKRSEDTKKKQSESAKRYLEENPRGPMSEEDKQKRRDTQTGVAKPEGHGAKVAAANRGIVSINKDSVEKKIKKDDLQQWLDQGWSKGGKPRLAQQGKNRGPYKSRTK